MTPETSVRVEPTPRVSEESQKAFIYIPIKVQAEHQSFCVVSHSVAIPGRVIRIELSNEVDRWEFEDRSVESPFHLNEPQPNMHDHLRNHIKDHLWAHIDKSVDVLVLRPDRYSVANCTLSKKSKLNTGVPARDYRGPRNVPTPSADVVCLHNCLFFSVKLSVNQIGQKLLVWLKPQLCSKILYKSIDKLRLRECDGSHCWK